jgi:tetratricopeptide (TPR) repeat protein
VSAYSKDSDVSGYRFLRPTAPLPGDREAAEPHFKEGLQWHRTGRQAIAVEHYQEATRLDPAFFEAYFNQGLAATEVANWKHALAAYEMALAINPDSAKAHYNFCMALKKANYPADALAQLKLLITRHPDDAKAHLAIANMYAQQFNQPDKARQHYLKLLELDPFNSEAPKIRYWLSTNR